MANSLRVALAQHLHTADFASLINDAASAGAEIIVFPELYSNGYAVFDDDEEAEKRWRAQAVKHNSEFINTFRDAARRAGIYVVTTFLEVGEPDPFNSAVLIDKGGDTVLHHRKVHTSFFDTPEKSCGRGESFRGSDIETRAGTVKVGLMICMDREYPQAAAALSADGVEIALVPNCCELGTDADVGDVRIAQTRGRAFESVMAIGVANYPSPRCDGHSFAVDPLGRVLVLADDQPALILADFDLDQIRKTRRDDWFRWRL